MVFTTSQMLGIGAFTAVVIVIGIMLLKLDTMVGSNHDVCDPAPKPGDSSSAPVRNLPARTRSPRRGRRH